MYKVTIMIPTYNQEDYILDAIKSALSQNYNNLEVIVSDDCSQDDTFKLVNSIKDKRLKAFRNSKNIGRVKNYRKLLYELSTGDFVINLDGDDYFIDDSFIECAIDLIMMKNVEMVFSNQIVGCKVNPRNTNMRLPETIDGNWLFLNYGKNGIHIPHMTALYRRSKAMKLNFYNKDIISSDWESLLRYILDTRIGFIQKPTGYWRQVDGSESKGGDIDKYICNIDGVASIAHFVEEKFTKAEVIEWKNRIITNMLKGIPYSVLYCDIRHALQYAYNNLTPVWFVKLIFHYRFLGKVIAGKVWSKCAE